MISNKLKTAPIAIGAVFNMHYFRLSIGTYSRFSCTQAYDGRMIFPPHVSSSIRWALQPAILAIANRGVYSAVGRFSIE